jgi:putative ABC transport system permease protein
MASTAGLSAYQRRRDLALLRAVGATPRQVRRLLLGEAVGVGTVGAVAGAGLGLLLAPILGDLLVRAQFEPPGFAVRFAVLPLTAAVGTGILVALLGTWAASRRAARVSPLEALRRAAADPPAASPGRLVLGGLFVAGGLGLAGLTPAVEPDYAITAALGSAMALMVGLALLAAVVIPPLVRLILAPRVVREAPIAVLVPESAVNAVRRTAATVAPVLLTVGFTVLVLGFVTTATPVFGAGGAGAAASTVVAAPDGSPGLSDAAVAALPGRVRSALSTRVFAVGTSGPPVALDALGADPAVLADLGVELEPEAVAVSATGSAGFGWRVGSVLRLVFADGAERSVRVVAVLPDADLPSPVLLRRATVRVHDPSALTPHARVTGSDVSTVDAALAGAPGARAIAASEYRDDDEDRLVWLFALIVVVVSVGYTGIAVANTVAMATVDRRPDLALLRLTGATRAQVMRAVVGETALGVALGATVGFAVALPALLGIRVALQEMTGGPVALVLPWAHTAAAVFACTVFALTAAVTAGRRAVQGNASDQVQWAM